MESQPGTRLAWTLGGIPVKEFPLQPGVNRIGRATSNDVRIDESTISGAHCELWLLEDALRVRDLGSTNGTYVGTTRITEAEIPRGESLRLGAIELTIANPPARVAIPCLPSPEPPAPQFLADGNTPCCHTHASLPACFRCHACDRTWCDTCVRRLRRIGGRLLVFCPECGAVITEGIAPPNRRRAMRSVLSWLDRVFDNFRPRPRYPKRRRRPSPD